MRIWLDLSALRLSRWMGRSRRARRPPGAALNWILTGLVLLLVWQTGLRMVRSLDVQAAVPVLTGKVIVIDPGHGGIDPGAVAGNVKEKEITLAVALQLRELLVQAGAKPVLTREADVDLRDRSLPGFGSIRRGELAARVQLVTEHKAHLFVSIHANKFGSNSPWRGAQVFYDPRGTDGGQTLARMLQEELQEQTGTRRVARPIEQFILEKSPVASATVEVGFLSNPEEAGLLQSPDYQKKLAYAIFAGLARFLAAQPGASLANN